MKHFWPSCFPWLLLIISSVDGHTQCQMCLTCAHAKHVIINLAELLKVLNLMAKLQFTATVFATASVQFVHTTHVHSIHLLFEDQ